MNLARLEHRLEHAERALLRAGLAADSVPGEPPGLAALLEAATDEELVRLDLAAVSGDDVAQAETLAAIARRLDEERPAAVALSPLQAAVAAERMRRSPDAAVAGVSRELVGWASRVGVEPLLATAPFSPEELRAIVELLGSAPTVFELGPAAVAALREWQALGRRRLERWRQGRTGLASWEARRAEARRLWAPRRSAREQEEARQAERVRAQVGSVRAEYAAARTEAEGEAVDVPLVAIPEPLFEAAVDESPQVGAAGGSSSAERRRPNARILWPGELAAAGAHGFVYERAGR